MDFATLNQPVLQPGGLTGPFFQGGFVGTLRVLPESVPFSVDPDGTVRVKNSTVLDREAIANVTFQVVELHENQDWANILISLNLLKSFVFSSLQKILFL